jgi:eukaryotic-like serine/threonine-protein kinase
MSMIGKTLGHYKIGDQPLGKGGMGEVYRAKDLKLGRDVAIKVLPEEFAKDAERVARFQREAKLLASLNHPNIAAIYGLEESGGTNFLVLELVEGATLADRIKAGPVPVEEALKLALQIAEALEAAHEKGVIHRDLKPANIKITPEGKVKVLDFGLAKAFAGDKEEVNLSNSPTLSDAATQQGVILGTAAYMSPEQAKGLAADQRSDVFSFGAVFYEMLTGRQGFQGDNVSEILASILAREPDMAALPANLNLRIPDLLRRCLDKNPKKRWHAAADMRVEIEAILTDPRGTLMRAQLPAVHKPLWKRALPILLAAIICSLITGIAVWKFKSSSPGIVTRFTFTLPGDLILTGAPFRHFLAISPDGTQFVYAANSRLYLKPMRELNSIAVRGTEIAIAGPSPVFSPDGQSLAFYASQERSYKRIAVSGGAPVTICQGDYPFGINWETNDQIVIGQGNKGIIRVSASGGNPETIVAVKENEFAHGPQILPGGNAILFTLASGGIGNRWDRARIVVQKISSGEPKTIIEGGTDARYLPTGHIIYALSGTLMAVPFDVKRMEKTGAQVPILEGVAQATSGTGASHFSFSENGTLIYFQGSPTASVQSSLALIDRKGVAKAIVVASDTASGSPRISPNGKFLAFVSYDETNRNVYVYDLSGASAVRRLTFGGNSINPIWSGDGQRILFTSDREGDSAIFWQRADGSGPAERLTKPEKQIRAHVPGAWVPNTNKFLLYAFTSGSILGVWTYSIQDRKASPFGDAAFLSNAEFSPDGRWLAYQSNETGRYEVYVQPYPPTGAKYQMTKGGGVDSHHPLWSPDGKELFYVNLTRLFSVSVQTQPGFSFGNPVQLPIDMVQLQVSGIRNYDITPDGKQFIALLPPQLSSGAARPAQQIQVVLNWFEELKQRVPVK